MTSEPTLPSDRDAAISPEPALDTPGDEPTTALSTSALLAPRRAMLRLVGVYLGSRGIGLLREIGTAYFFGTSVAADRWAGAFVVASLAAIITGEAAYAASLRWLGQENGSADESAYGRLLRGGARVATFVTAGFCLVGPVVTVAVIGSPADNWTEAAFLSLLLAPSVGANLLGSCINAKLTLERRFVLINSAQALYSVGAVIGLAVVGVAGASIGPGPLAAGWSAGNLAALVVLYTATRPRVRASDKAPWVGIRPLLTFGIPVAIAYSLIAVQALTDQAVAARLGTGRLAALSYANRLFLLPVGFVIAAFGPMVLSTLTVAQARARAHVAPTAVAQLRVMAHLLIPASVLFAAFAPFLVSALLSYGAFNSSSLELTTSALDGFAVGIAATGLSLLLFRAMQAVALVRQLVIVSICAVVLNAALTIWLAALIGVFGISLSTSIVSIMTACVQTVLLGQKLGREWARDTMRAVLIPIVFTCAAAATLILVDRAGLVSHEGRLVLGVLLAALCLPAILPLLRGRKP